MMDCEHVNSDSECNIRQRRQPHHNCMASELYFGYTTQSAPTSCLQVCPPNGDVWCPCASSQCVGGACMTQADGTCPVPTTKFAPISVAPGQVVKVCAGNPAVSVLLASFSDANPTLNPTPRPYLTPNAKSNSRLNLFITLLASAAVQNQCHRRRVAVRMTSQNDTSAADQGPALRPCQASAVCAGLTLLPVPSQFTFQHSNHTIALSKSAPSCIPSNFLRRAHVSGPFGTWHMPWPLTSVTYATLESCWAPEC
jgi:hypothetical protein